MTRRQEAGEKRMRAIVPWVVCLLVVLLVGAAGAAAAGGEADDPTAIVLAYDYVGDIDKLGFNEPSGIVYHAARGTLFVVGDEGDICEIETDGTPVKQTHVRDGDFEGVTYNPATGLLYVAVEGEERILEIHPDDFRVLREFQIERSYKGVELLKPGGQGIEAIAFVPDSAHPEGGTFYLANQGFALHPTEDPSVIVEVVVPLKSDAKAAAARGVRALHVGVLDIAAMHYDTASGHIYIVSDATNTLFEMDTSGKLLRGWAFPCDNQEGITVDPQGFLYVAQDHGGIIKLKWREGGPAGRGG